MDENKPAAAPPKYKCSLKRCIQEELTLMLARVEVKTFEVPKDEKEHMMVDWIPSGEAMFHDICWKALTDSVKFENPFTFCPREREMVLEARKTAEFFDPFPKVEAEGLRIARMLRTANWAIAFTGAGTSTAAGIADFRGKSGQWTERDREKSFGANKNKRSHTTSSNYEFEKVRPTYTHEALCKLLELGYLKHIVSQNTDGLHRLSGVPRDKLSELHGNLFHEKCEECGARYERPFAVRRQKSDIPLKICAHCNFDHRTGRKCERKECEGALINTIINFGDSLEKKVLVGATEQAKRNDLVLCMGSSLRVTPACDLLEMGKVPVRLIICNRQPTQFDRICYQVADPKEGRLGSRVYGDCDMLMREVMKNLLPPDILDDWLDQREARMAECDTKRDAAVLQHEK